MIDYLYLFPDAGTAHAVLDPMGFGNLTTGSGWDEDLILTVKLIVALQWTGADDAGQPTLVPVYANGYWLVISPPAVREDLWAIPYCMLEADREANIAKLPYVLRDRLSAEQRANPWRLDRQWAGVDYSNGGDLPILGAPSSTEATGATGATGSSA